MQAGQEPSLKAVLGEDHPQLVYPRWGCKGELATSFPAEGPADLRGVSGGSDMASSVLRG